ncbi:hypothetical protein AB0909_00655 [Streptomyces albidoflavus]|uniref:hypothetical protein n=1 Tax=Streptomyces albidoflavus TaxID=1886 RepID=UPI0034530E64
MTARERLLAEELPTGTFGRGERPRRPAPRPWTPEEQAAHYAELAAALGEPLLRVVPGAAA